MPPKVHVTARPDGDEWEISCQDNGIGIEPEFAEKIFVIFQRLHAKDAYPGTGIGLAMSRRSSSTTAAGSGWTPAPARASAFPFTLPARHAPGGSQDRDSRVRSVLLVEDDPGDV